MFIRGTQAYKKAKQLKKTVTFIKQNQSQSLMRAIKETPQLQDKLKFDTYSTEPRENLHENQLAQGNKVPIFKRQRQSMPPTNSSFS